MCAGQRFCRMKAPEISFFRIFRSPQPGNTGTGQCPAPNARAYTSSPSTQRRMAFATPSLLFVSVCTSAAATASGVALPMATPSPAARSMAISFEASPQAMVCPREKPSRPASAS